MSRSIPEPLWSKTWRGAWAIVVWPLKLHRPRWLRIAVFAVALLPSVVAALLYSLLLLIVMGISALIRYGAIATVFVVRLLLGKEAISLDHARNSLQWGVQALRWPSQRSWSKRLRQLAFVVSIPVKILAAFASLGGAVLGVLLPLILVPAGWLFRKLMSLGGKSVLGPYDRAAHAYHAFLPKALAHPFLVLGFAAAAFLASLALIPTLGMDLIPQLAQGRFEMTVKMPPGTALTDTDALVKELEEKNAKDPNIALIYGVSGTGTRLDANPTESGENIARMLVVLKPGVGDKGERMATESLRAAMTLHPGTEVKFSRPQLFSFATPLEIELRGYDLASLEKGRQQTHRADVRVTAIR